MPEIPAEYLNQIVTGDARKLAKRIPDESVDLVFTDPIYSNIDDYRWLAETAARVLKPDKACLVWTANPRIIEIANVMNRHLKFVLPLNYIVQAKGYLMFSRKIFVWSTLCLWFEKGRSSILRAMPDSVISGGRPDSNFKWNKNLNAIIGWLAAFTQPNDTVLDPFTGGGTVPAVCKMLGRNYIAFEIDPDTAEDARERVLNTQPPLFVLEPEQQEMILA